MNDYYLRCRMSDFPTMLGLGRALGVIQYIDGKITPVGEGVWDEIGWKYPAVDEGKPQGEPAGGAADPWMHVNFRTKHNIRAISEQLASARPDIAAGLAQLPRYFITDDEGNAVAPEVPLRVFL
jgi:hypothetical protein